MKATIILFIRVNILVFIIAQQIFAQTVITNGTSLVVASGGRLVSTKNFFVDNGGNLDVKGILSLKNDFQNYNTSFDVVGTGTLEFTGNVNQNLTGPNSIQNITVNNAAGLSIGSNTTVNGTMTLNSGKVTIGANNLVMGINAVFAGTPSATAMIVPTGTGQIIKWFLGSATGTYPFPVGDTTGIAEYSPVTLVFTQGQVYNTGYITINLANSKYPDPGITGNYLNRYWNLASADFVSFNCDATFQYLPADVTGSEDVLSCTRVNPLPWATYGLTNAASHQLTATGLTSFGSFTGLKSSTTPANLDINNVTIGPGVSNCYDALQVLRVAGNGTTFTVNSGGSATLIAGQKIFLLPGTKVFQGGYLLGKISTNGQYCGSLPNPLVNNPDPANDVLSGITEFDENQQVRVYPNPTSGQFTVELNGKENSRLTRIEVFNMNGIKVSTEEIHGERKHLCSGSDFLPGIYFIRVYSASQIETVKLIRK